MKKPKALILCLPEKPKNFFAICVFICLILAPISSLLAQPASPPPITLEKIKNNIYLIKGGAGANCYLIAGKKDNLLVDAKMTDNSFREMISEIKKVTGRPVAMIILTHSDGDHVNGLAGLTGEMKILAHQKTYEEMLPQVERTPELKKILPTETYEGTKVLDFAGSKLELKNFGPAHTSGDTVIFIPDSRLAIVGDLMFFGRDPLIHLHKNGSFYGYLKTLQNLLPYKPEIEIFLSGHAEPANRQQVAGLIDYLNQKEKQVRQLIDKGKTLEEIKSALGPQAPAGSTSRWPSLVEVIYQEIKGKN